MYTYYSFEVVYIVIGLRRLVIAKLLLPITFPLTDLSLPSRIYNQFLKIRNANRF